MRIFRFGRTASQDPWSGNICENWVTWDGCGFILAKRLQAHTEEAPKLDHADPCQHRQTYASVPTRATHMYTHDVTQTQVYKFCHPFAAKHVSRILCVTPGHVPHCLASTAPPTLRCRWRACRPPARLGQARAYCRARWCQMSGTDRARS